MKKVLSIVLSSVMLFGCTCGQSRRTLSGQKEGSYLALSEIQDNSEARNFANSIVGKWETVFTYPDRDNIKAAEFAADGAARVEVTKGKTTGRLITGKYRIEFEREPDPDKKTLGRIVIETVSDEYVLSRVNFGAHSGVPFSGRKHGPLLRIDEEPYGVLNRANKGLNSDF